MDQLVTLKRNVHCKTENENDLTNFQLESYIKEEIILPDITEYFDDETLSTANCTLLADKISRKLDKNESKLALKEEIYNENSNSDEEIDVVNVDEHSEKLFVEIHKNKNIKGSNNIEIDNFDNKIIPVDQCSINTKVDVTSYEESLLNDVSDQLDECEDSFSDEIYTPKYLRETKVFQEDTNDKDKENNALDEKECNKSQKQKTILNFFKRLSRGSSKLSPITNNTPKAVVDKDVLKTTSKDIKNKKCKLNYVMFVCQKCTRKEKVLRRRQKVTCLDCKERMIYECLMCGHWHNTLSTFYKHMEKNCRRKRIYQREPCSYRGKNKHLPILRCKFCPFHTKYKPNLTRHMRKCHKNVKSQQDAGIIKKITDKEEEIKDNVLNSTDNPEQNKLQRRDDYKKFIQLFCIKCDKIQNMKDYKKQNCSKCGASMLLQCVKCAKHYSKFKAIYSHLYQKCGAPHLLQCVHCDYMSPSKKTLQAHIGRKHMVVAPEDYERCSKCDSSFKFRDDMIVHEKRCGWIATLQSELCPFKSESKKYFNSHLQNDVPVEATPNTPKPMNKKEKLKVEKLLRAFCPKCKKRVKYSNPTKRKCVKCGMKLTHPCAYCNNVYQQSCQLRVHLIRSHLSIDLKKRQQCSKCQKKFTVYNDLQSHQKRCLVEPELQCSLCPFKTKYPRSITLHLQRLHSKDQKRFNCKDCGKIYGNNQALRRHMLHYCGKQPSFACDYCSYKSYRRYEFMFHLKTMHNLLFDQEL